MTKRKNVKDRNLRGLLFQVRNALDTLIDYADPELGPDVFESKHGDLANAKVVQIAKVALNALDEFIRISKKSYTWQEYKDTFFGGKDPTTICPECGFDLSEWKSKYLLRIKQE